MFAYFKQCEYPNIRNKLFIIYALNINDIQLTWFLLKTGMFIEVNPVMDFFIATTYLAVITKVVLPAALLFYVGYQAEERKRKPAAGLKHRHKCHLYYLHSHQHNAPFLDSSLLYSPLSHSLLNKSMFLYVVKVYLPFRDFAAEKSVMANKQERAFTALQHLFQRGQNKYIKIVRRLVQQHYRRVSAD